MNLIIQIFEALIELLKGIIDFIVEGIEFAFKISKKNKVYNAEFAPQGILLSKYNRGFCMTGRRNLTKKDCYRELSMIAKHFPVTANSSLTEYRGAQANYIDYINSLKHGNPDNS